MMKKIAVLYMRMSTDMQEHSIESQERVLMEYAKRNGYVVIRKYIDRGISGQHASKRPDFLKMIDDSETGEFQFVLIYDSSRFARNLVESLTYKSILKENFDAVQEIIAERAKHYKKNEKPAEFRKHWLSGLLVCPHCGAGYSYNTRKPPQHDAFRCGNQTRGACKKGSSILVDVAVEMVLDKLSEVYAGPLAPYVKNITVSQPEPQIDYDKEIKLLEAQLKRAKQAYLAEIDTIDEYAQNKRRIASNIKELHEAKNQAQEGAALNEPQFKVKLLNAITLLKSDCPMSEKIPAARSIIEKILVDPRNKTMDIYFFA